MKNQPPYDEDDIADWAADFVARRDRAQRGYRARRPKRIGNIVAQLITSRGYDRTETDRQLGQVWTAVAGSTLSAASRPCGVRRGQLEVLVANSTILQELTFQKRRLLAELKSQLPQAQIRGLRFRIGRLD